MVTIENIPYHTAWVSTTSFLSYSSIDVTPSYLGQVLGSVQN